MEAKELVALNNEKRKRLTDENLAYYEDMLVYIRLNLKGSEQQTEEVLMEILDHLLLGQSEGKTAQAIFGENLKAYCEEIIAEIPKEKSRDNVLFSVYIVLQFLAVILVTNGIVGYGLYIFGGFGSEVMKISVGAIFIKGLVALIELAFYLWLLVTVIRKTLFSNAKREKIYAYLMLFLLTSTLIGVFILIQRIVPDFGSIIEVPIYTSALIGLIFYIISYIMNKRFRIV